jgi:hypothetical protein
MRGPPDNLSAFAQRMRVDPPQRQRADSDRSMGLFSKTPMELAVNHHQRKVLHAIFAHPVNANLNLKDVTNVLTGLGAEIDAKAKSRISVTLNGQSTILHLSNHSLLKAEVMQIRKFLESCGIAAEAFPV